MMDFIDALVRAIRSLVRSLEPSHLRKVAAEVPLYAPLAVRSVRRRALRYLLVGLCLGAGIVVFLALGASFRGAASAVAGKTEDLVLPADIVAFGVQSEGSQPPEALKWVSQAGAYETFDRWTAETTLGTRWVIGLAPGGRLLETSGLGEAPGEGEVLVPESLAAAAGVAVGDLVEVGLTGPEGFRGQRYRVAGLFGGAAGADALFGGAIVMSLPDLLTLRSRVAGPGGHAAAGDGGTATGEAGEPALPNSVAVWERDPGDLDRLLAKVKELFPKAEVWWPRMPADRAFRAVGGFLSPGNIVLALVFIMAGLGVFNVMLLTLLQRKVPLGVLKALGAVDDEVFLLLLLEGALTAAGGTILGLLGGVGLVQLLDRASLVPLSLSGWSLVWAVVLATVSFYLAAWLPATLCRRASPVQLMAGRRLYLNPRSTCAQCGRCGGF